MALAGEIRLFAGNFAPDGWAFCHGQLASIAGVSRLFDALGNRYGGDGETTFALPDLRGRAPVHRSHAVGLGEAGGAEFVALTAAEMPDHGHAIPFGARPASDSTNARLAIVNAGSIDSDASRAGVASRGTTTVAGLGNAHANLQPYLCLNYIIALGDDAASSDSSTIVGEIRPLAGEAVPAGWTPCDGTLLDVSIYGGLYSVIGTTYGGDGRRAFAVPDLRARVALQAGHGHGLTPRRLGETGGVATVVIHEEQLPGHDHQIETVTAVSGGLFQKLAPDAGPVASHPGDVRQEQRLVSIATTCGGGNARHSNLQPYLALNFCIAYAGTRPHAG